MPANLTPQYYAAEDKYRQARTTEDRIKALEEMLQVIPKHKGTEKLQGDIKKRIARFRDESKKKKQGKGGYDPFGIEKQGAGQVVLAGYPNCGKSSLVGALSRAKVKIADYPFATALPVSGMMPYKDTFVQLVDTPPLSVDNVPPGLVGTFKEADALLVVIDLFSPDCLDQLEGLNAVLREREVVDLTGETDILTPIPYVVAGNKADAHGAADNLEVLRELAPGLDILPVSGYGFGLEELKERLYAVLEIIRVYGKAVGRPADKDRPFILRRGSTVLDFAALVHRDFPGKLKSALVWGSAKFDGQAVAKDYVLEDGDVVELQL